MQLKLYLVVRNLLLLFLVGGPGMNDTGTTDGVASSTDAAGQNRRR